MNVRALWEAIPASIRQPFKSWLVSGLLGLQPTASGALVGGATAHAVDLSNFSSCVHYLSITWWGIFLGAFFAIGPLYRAKQGSDAAKTLVVTPPNSTVKAGEGP